ncbi:MULTISPECIES: GntR family transcriptional regulator [Frankia]|uniref:Regulatory protein KorSA, GntR-family transcriptional regulator n=1 Tax=Frankia alni (strain DSM 45986 / CECT 9034 / ACN14a) TaxID=326424 RepID=Q0RTY2_FRAAA|nr:MULTISPECIES: GntR family transcriptional regulator [Frankia]CAJ58964.1 Putative regulatory protein KorSA, GntR-family transcriptional regulator [Frankia alni ACN14a]
MSSRRGASDRIWADLREQIASGRLAPGAALPSTAELARHYGVASETARLAVTRLKEEGLVSGRAGAGVYVRSRPPLRRLGIDRYDKAKWQGADLVAFAADRVASGRSWEPGDQTQTVRRVPAAPDVAAALAVDQGADVYERARLIREHDQPTHTLTSYYRPEHVEGTHLTDDSAGPAGPGGGFRVLTDQGLEPAWIDEELQARMPTPEEVATLQLPPGEPVVELHRTTFTAEDTPVEYAIGVHPASRFAWSYRFQIPDSAGRP